MYSEDACPGFKWQIAKLFVRSTVTCVRRRRRESGVLGDARRLVVPKSACLARNNHYGPWAFTNWTAESMLEVTLWAAATENLAENRTSSHHVLLTCRVRG